MNTVHYNFVEVKNWNKNNLNLLQIVKEQRPIKFKTLDQQRITKLEIENGKITNENNDLKQLTNFLKEKANQQDRRIKDLENELKIRKEENGKLTNEIDDVKRQNNDLKNEANEQDRRMNDLEKELNATKEENGKLKSDVKRQNNILKNKTDEQNDLMKDLENNMNLEVTEQSQCPT